ncbi:hypothetical protein SVAN01_09054 [Stagonosporopsis vannaccii]|nr:hypothetical protein SVAN01_09054 [Stagonosporopsis vannaccii]
MQLPRRSVRSIQELPSIYTAFPASYRPVRTHSASTASDSARSPDVEDGLEVVPLEHDSIRSAPIVSAHLDEKEVLISTQEVPEKPLPKLPASLWGRMWGRMSVKYRVLAVLGVQAVILLTIGMALLTTRSKHAEYDGPCSIEEKVVKTGNNDTDTSSIAPIERGTFSVPIHFPQQQSSACLARSNESRVWQCAFDTMLQLSILPSLGDDGKPVMITLGPPSTSNRSVHCGQQAPEIGPTALTVSNETNAGPQYHFAATYDRTVILREGQLGQEKMDSLPMQGQSKHTNFVSGQSLWRCTFNDTLLQGFIYAGNEGDTGPTTTNTATEASSALPYKVKLVETKVASGSVPYCEKVVVGVDGGLEEDGESVHLGTAGAQSGSSSSQGDVDASCACQWVVG